MAKEIVMPQMGAEMEEGTIIRWTKQIGDPVARGETIGEIETDKATVDLESYDEGFFLGAIVPDGTTVPVGTVIGYLGAQGEALPAGEGSGGAQPAAAPRGAPLTATNLTPPPAAPLPARSTSGEGTDARAHVSPTLISAPPNGRQPAPAGAGGQRLRASPVARAIAAELGVDLAALLGSGPDGRIMRRDVEEAARSRPAATAQPAAATVEAVTTAIAPPPPPRAEPVTVAPVVAEAAPAPAGELEPLTRMRQTIARRMAAAKREIPHYYLTISADMGEALAFRKSVNASLPDEGTISVNDLIVKACALALEAHPRFNMTFTEEGLRRNTAINIGIAVALDDGLVVPAVLNCGGKSLGAIAREARDAAERARNGRLRAAELTDGTFTVSNLGMYGVETLIAIIQPGQSAILGVGRVEPRPVVRDGQVVARDMLTLALSADHRVTDGAQGARFLAAIRDVLEHPGRLVL